jgi:hypothetical protein
LPVFSEKPVA